VNETAIPAVYRAGASAGATSTWFYRGSLNNPSGNVSYVPWGVSGDKVAPGDYDGDGKSDFVIARTEGANLRFWKRLTTGTVSTELYGLSSDQIVPGDYDGDGKTDVAVVRNPGAGSIRWFIEPSAGGAQSFTFGTATDFTAQGDYDGDGKTDVAIWRPSTGTFWWLNSGNSTVQTFALGGSNDSPIAFYNRH
jgi:spore coat protein A